MARPGPFARLSFTVCGVALRPSNNPMLVMYNVNNRGLILWGLADEFTSLRNCHFNFHDRAASFGMCGPALLGRARSGGPIAAPASRCRIPTTSARCATASSGHGSSATSGRCNGRSTKSKLARSLSCRLAALVRGRLRRGRTAQMPKHASPEAIIVLQRIPCGAPVRLGRGARPFGSTAKKSFTNELEILGVVGTI